MKYKPNVPDKTASTAAENIFNDRTVKLYNQVSFAGTGVIVNIAVILHSLQAVFKISR